MRLASVWFFRVNADHFSECASHIQRRELVSITWSDNQNSSKYWNYKVRPDFFMQNCISSKCESWCSVSVCGSWHPLLENTYVCPTRRRIQRIISKPRSKYLWKFESLNLTIDYRCDDGGKKLGVGATPWYHCVAEDSRIPKMPVISPLQALVHPQTHKNYPARIVIPQPQLLRIRLFW